MKQARKQRKSHGARLACALLMATNTLTIRTATAAGDPPDYDRRIEEAAIRMLQPKLGTIRGSLDLVARNHLFPPLSQRANSREDAEWPAPSQPETRDGSILRY